MAYAKNKYSIWHHLNFERVERTEYPFKHKLCRCFYSYLLIVYPSTLPIIDYKVKEKT